MRSPGPCVRAAGHPRSGHRRAGGGRQTLQHVGGGDAAGALLEEDRRGRALGAAGLGRVDRHVVVQRGEDGADEGVGGLRLRRELGDGGPRAEVDADGHADHAVVLAQPGHREGDLVVLGGQGREGGQALAGRATTRPELDVDNHGLRLGLLDGLRSSAPALNALRSMLIAPCHLREGKSALLPRQPSRQHSPCHTQLYGSFFGRSCPCRRTFRGRQRRHVGTVCRIPPRPGHADLSGGLVLGGCCEPPRPQPRTARTRPAHRGCRPSPARRGGWPRRSAGRPPRGGSRPRGEP